MRRMVTCCVLAGILGGCAGSADRIERLQGENQQLQQQLTLSRQDVDTLTAEKAVLQDKIADLKRFSGTLQREKRARVEEADQLRKAMRDFIQRQMDALREFSQRQDFYDYIGAELVNRQHSGDENLTLVDNGSRLPGSGTLLAVRGYFIVPCRLRLMVLRPNGKVCEVVQVSASLEIAAAGLNQVDLPVPMAVRRGDLLGFSFSGPVGIPFDEKTGDTLLFSDPLKAGSRLQVPEPKNTGKRRAYSIGGVGLFQ